jgi:apolipoprotein N-acyltransferase
MKFIIAVLAGASLVFAFAPFSLYPIAVLALTILFYLWQSVSPRDAFKYGFLFGIGFFGFGISWIHSTIYQFGGVPFVGAIVLTFILVLFMALYIAILGWLVTRYFAKNNIYRIIFILPAAWTLIEWLRGWFLTGFPWLSIGYSQIDSPLSGFAPLLGVYGVTWITVLTAGILVYLIKFKKCLISIFIILIWSSGWLLSDISWTQAENKTLNIALVQANIPQDFKWESNNQIPTINRYLRLSKLHYDADIIIWPETAIPIFYHQAENLVKSLAKIDTNFLIGIPVMEPDGRYYNSITNIGKNEFYYKHHLVPFGEYIPLQAILGNILKLLDVPMSEFTAGAKKQTTLNVDGIPIGASICYEDAFGDLVRQSLPEAKILVNISNDAWFGESIAPDQHLEIARMRALEAGRYLLRATNTGISAVINEKGKITIQSPQFETMTLRATAQAYTGTTPYVIFGDWLIIGLLFFIVLVGVLRMYLVIRV